MDKDNSIGDSGKNSNIDSIELGGNIVLSGFRPIDGATMVIVKKMVGNYTRKLSDRSSSFERLTLTMKNMHDIGISKTFELHAKLEDNGKVHNSEAVDNNIFLAVDTVLKKIEHCSNVK